VDKRMVQLDSTTDSTTNYAEKRILQRITRRNEYYN